MQQQNLIEGVAFTPLQILKQTWLLAKQKETETRNARVEAEGEIYMYVEKQLAASGQQLKDSGVNNVGEGIKITTGFTEKWDQEALKEIQSAWQGNLWPFKSEFKKDGALLKALAETNKDGYATVSKALTLTPCKPTFAVKE